MVTDAIMITMAMLIDLKLLHRHSAEVEVEVRRVGERIEPLCGQIGLLEEQWELTEGQESHNLAVNSVDSTHEDKISVKETKSSRAV